MPKQTLSPAAISGFSLQLYQLISAGISADEALQILLSDTKDTSERAMLSRLISRIQTEFMPLSAALEQEGIFPPYMTQMLALGEESGNTDTVLKALSDHYERENLLNKSIQSAVFYPAIMAVMMTGLLLIFSLYVLPAFSGIFASLGLEMSRLSVIMMSLGKIVTPIAAVALILALLIGGFYFLQWKKGGKTPLSNSSLARQIAAGRFISALALMHQSGIDTAHSTQRAGELSGRDDFIQGAKTAANRIQDEAISLSQALSEMDLLSEFHLRMIHIGESTGTTDRMLNEVATRLSAEASERTEKIISTVEPAVIVILALVAGLSLLSIMLPLLGILSAAS